MSGNRKDTLQVTYCYGDHFAATIEVGDEKCTVKGTVIDGKFSWYSRDVQVLKGSQAQHGYGMVKNETLTLNWPLQRPQKYLKYVLTTKYK